MGSPFTSAGVGCGAGQETRDGTFPEWNGQHSMDSIEAQREVCSAHSAEPEVLPPAEFPAIAVKRGGEVGRVGFREE